MISGSSLHDALSRAAAERPTHPAVEEAGGAVISYADLAALSDRVRDRLLVLGVGPGERVGVWVRKSIDSVAAIFGVLKTGAAYVPVDPAAPAARNAYILADCSVRAVVLEQDYEMGLRAELGPANTIPEMIILQGTGGGRALRVALDALDEVVPALPGRTARSSNDDLAYILYTSGSTGKPKGVMLTHENACSFLDWCSETMAPLPADRFSAHAPFHFDLSILDLYLSVRHGATMVLIGEDLGREPVGLARLIADARITMWYSAPSILRLMVQSGVLDHHDYRHLRAVLFAGEVFPIPHLRALKRAWPHPEYFNLYGPTETNVCTYYRLPDTIPEDRLDPFPIGKVCSHLRDLVIDASGQPVEGDCEGELCIAGSGVMRGYWNDAARTDARFITVGPTRWYRTGDLVIRDARGDYIYHGRLDRMVKKRGYRVELGEIEACLSSHPEAREVAVVALPHEEMGQLVKAHIGTEAGTRLSIVKLKQFCSGRLPAYMIPDRFQFHESLPKTSTGKTDYQSLVKLG